MEELCYLRLLGRTRRLLETLKSKKYMATGGMPPDGVKLLSRYHNLDGTGGFAVVESSDPTALANWALDWNGLIEIKITAIMDDETIGGVLGKKFALSIS